MKEKNNIFTLKHNVNNKIRLIPSEKDTYLHHQVYNMMPNTPQCIIEPYSKYYTRKIAITDDDKLEKMDINVIEQFLRKKKLLKISSL